MDTNIFLQYSASLVPGSAVRGLNILETKYFFSLNKQANPSCNEFGLAIKVLNSLLEKNGTELLTAEGKLGKLFL